MQTLFTHVAKIGLDYIVCDPTVPCPPTPVPPGPSQPPGGGPQEHVPDQEVYWYTDALGNPKLGSYDEVMTEGRRAYAIVTTAPVVAIVTTGPVDGKVTTAPVLARLETDDE